jgi:hypothetical protein
VDRVDGGVRFVERDDDEGGHELHDVGHVEEDAEDDAVDERAEEGADGRTDRHDRRAHPEVVHRLLLHACAIVISIIAVIRGVP